MTVDSIATRTMLQSNGTPVAGWQQRAKEELDYAREDTVLASTARRGLRRTAEEMQAKGLRTLPSEQAVAVAINDGSKQALPPIPGVDKAAGKHGTNTLNKETQAEGRHNTEESKLAHGRLRILEYLEDTPVSSHPDDSALQLRADLEAGLATMSRRSQRIEIPGAYSCSMGEGCQRQYKVQNCGQILATDHSSANSDSSNNTDDDQIVPAPGPTTKEDAKWWLQKPYIIAITLFSSLVVLSVVITVAVLESKPTESYEMEEAIPLIETRPEDDINLSLVPNMEEATIQAILEDPLSPQSQAYEWISTDPSWESYEDWRKQQRFAMACLDFALCSDSNRGHLVHECDWIPQVEACQGIDKREVNFLAVTSTHSCKGKTQLPEEIGFLSHLEVLQLSHVKVGGIEEGLPLETLSTMPHFKELTLRDCDLTGEIPSSLGLLTSLTSLDLSQNHFTGTVPKEIGELPSLQSFIIKENPGLEGPFPLGFCP